MHMRGIARAAIARWKPPAPSTGGSSGRPGGRRVPYPDLHSISHRQRRYDVHVDDFKPKVGDPLHEPAEGSLIWQLGAKGCRAGTGADLAVVEFRAQRGARLARESDLICCDRTMGHTPRSLLVRACCQTA